MCGAIALVLYESGIAHELIRLIRSQASTKSPASKAYQCLLSNAKLSPIVDILSGASAGGINTVFLASCITSDTDFSKFREPWIETASVAKLRYGNPESSVSLLNPEPLLAQIRPILKAKATLASTLGLPLPDISVQICRTDLQGITQKTTDALGRQMLVETKANVISFTNEHFQGVGVDQLKTIADAAAATSAVPFIFPSVLGLGQNNLSDRWYSDGGLLDNQPVDLAIKAIQDKPAFGQTYRCILFSEPDPITKPLEESEKQPTAVQLLSSLPFLGVKGNMWPALCDITEYNSRLRLFKIVQAEVENECQLDKQKFASHWEALAVKAQWELYTQPLCALQIQVTSVNTARAHDLLFNGEPALITRWNKILLSMEAIDESSAMFRTNAFKALRAMLACLYNIGWYDFERAALRRKLNNLNEELKDNRQNHTQDPSADVIAAEKAALYTRIEQINTCLTEPNDPDSLQQTGNDSRFKKCTETMLCALSEPDINIDDVIDDILKIWVNGVQAIATTYMPVLYPPTQITSSTLRLYHRSKHGANAAKATALFENEWLAIVKLSIAFKPSWEDILHYVLGSLSDLDGKAPIDLIRISPPDCKNFDLIDVPNPPANLATSTKLAGELLGHGGGLLSEQWRRNDYIWGRLDACETLIRTVQKYSDGLVTLEEAEVLIHAAQTEILKDEANVYATSPNIPKNPPFPSPDKFGHPVDSDPDTIEANKLLIGFGTQTLGDLPEPQLASDIGYAAAQAVQVLRGSSDKAPAQLEVIERAARVVSYIAQALTWLFPTAQAKSRNVVLFIIAGLLVCTFFFALGLSWQTDPTGYIKIVSFLRTIGEVFFCALFFIGLGCCLGVRYGIAVCLSASALTAAALLLHQAGKVNTLVGTICVLLSAAGLILSAIGAASSKRTSSGQ